MRAWRAGQTRKHVPPEAVFSWEEREGARERESGWVINKAFHARRRTWFSGGAGLIQRWWMGILSATACWFWPASADFLHEEHVDLVEEVALEEVCAARCNFMRHVCNVRTYHHFWNQPTPCLAAINDPTKAMNFWANLLHSCTVLVCECICPVWHAVLGGTDDCTTVRRNAAILRSHHLKVNWSSHFL